MTLTCLVLSGFTASNFTNMEFRVLVLFVACIICLCNGNDRDPKISDLENTIYKLQIKLIVCYVLSGLLILIIILMIRIARTYKLSLISAESKLSALLIHSETLTMNNTANNPANNSNMFQFTSPNRNFYRSESSNNVTTNVHPQPQKEKPSISPLRNGSIWRKIGDYIIHVNENGDVESHNINQDKEDSFA